MLSDRQYMDSNRHAGRVGFNMSVVKALMWANAIVFVLTGFGQHQATGALALGAAPIRRFEIWRLVSYMFAHGDWGHLIFNMWGVFIFGRLLEQRLGSRRFLQLYLTSGLIGGGIWLLANWGTSHFVIGASGALFGLLMAAAMAFPGLVVTLLFPPIPVRLKTLVFVYGVIEVA
ncbi:MAG: rhomboid family intramembrane serine protease, partial [Lentisphaerae bacterium]|nr:rhomboid family intramembrane serine protease [Lentisphaerota bacterium]